MRSFLLGILLLHLTLSNAQHKTDALPDMVVLQHGGSIGWWSIGAGYRFLSNHIEPQLLYGRVPESKGGVLDLITLKLSVVPYRWKGSSGYAIAPFNPVFFASTTLNKGYHLFWPDDQYVDDYYWWSSAMRFHLGFNSEIDIPLHKRVGKKLTVYAEWNTNDLYLSSYLENKKSISLWDITALGVGIKWHFK